jgi:hypothetical protein
MIVVFICEKKLRFLWKGKVRGGGHSQNKWPRTRAIIEFGITFKECPPLVDFAHCKA